MNRETGQLNIWGILFFKTYEKVSSCFPNSNIPEIIKNIGVLIPVITEKGIKNQYGADPTSYVVKCI